MSSAIASLPTPFNLTFARCDPKRTTHPTALRIFVDGGARRRDKLAAIGYQIRKGPFINSNAVYPDERDGTQVAAGEFQVEYPAKDETDNVECELTSAAVALFVLFERGEYRADLYTDCKTVAGTIGSASFSRDYLNSLKLRLTKAQAHATTHGGKIILLHVLRRYNKIADGLCNKAMDNWCTPFVPKLLLTKAYRPPRDATTTLGPAKAARDQPNVAWPAPPALPLSYRQASAIAFMRGLHPDAVAHSDIPTFAEIPSKALCAVARGYHYMLDNLASQEKKIHGPSRRQNGSSAATGTPR